MKDFYLFSSIRYFRTQFKLLKMASTSLLVLSLMLFASHVKAEEERRECGEFGTENIFEPGKWPIVDLDSFASGRLGVIRPTFDHFYLFIAYRVLAGLPISNKDIESLRPHDPCWISEARGYSGYEPTASKNFITDLQGWEKLRQKIGGATLAQKLEARRMTNYGYGEFLNCNADAFKNASKTLAERVAVYGVSDDVRNWLSGQDAVFSNCATEAKMPDDMPRSAPRWLQSDRQYQKAAAHFYAGRYVDAIKGFDAIAITTDSPWREIAPYLSARSVIRSARMQDGSLDKRVMIEAELRLTEMLKRPLNPVLHRDVLRLLQFVQIRTRPDDVRKRLDEHMRARNLPDSIGQDVTDFWVAELRSGDESGASSPPFSVWVSAMRKEDDADLAFSRWRDTHELIWLVAAIGHATFGSGGADELISAAKAIKPNSPAYITMQYHLVRLTTNANEAIRIAENVLSLPPSQLSIQDVNAIKRAALGRALSVADFSRYAPRQSAVSARGMLPVSDDDAIQIIDTALPIDVLAKMAFSKNLPVDFSDELTLVLCARAFVLERWDIVRLVAPRIKKIIPESSGMVDEMLKTNGVERRAIGAMLITRYPGIIGNMNSTIHYSNDFNDLALPNMHRSMRQDGERQNWWCGFPGNVYWQRYSNQKSIDLDPPSFLTKSERGALLTERTYLRTVPNATDYLGDIVMQWAKVNPRDPRLPRTLNMLVRSSRGGCVESNSKLSYMAFKHLHRYFPNNQWTKKTPVHYGY